MHSKNFNEDDYTWLTPEGFVILDLSSVEQAIKPGKKVEQIASQICPYGKVKLLEGNWTENNTNKWAWAEPSDLDALVQTVFSNDGYSGNLFIILGEPQSSLAHLWLSDRISDQAAFGQRILLKANYQAAQKAWQEKDSYEIEELVCLLLHLWRQVSTHGRAICCLNTPELPFSDPDCFCPDGRTRIFEEIDFSDTRFLESYLRTILMRSSYRISPTVAEKPLSKVISLSEAVSKEWDNYSLQPKMVEYEDLLRQELGSRRISRSFMQNCIEAFRGASETPGSGYVLLPAEFLVAIGSLRLARRLANWTIEGTSFCCTVALFSAKEHASLGHGSSSFSNIIDIEPDIPFNFQHEDAIRKHAEAAQGEGLFLLVNASTGMLTTVACHNKPNSHLRHRRHSFLSSLVSRRGILIHIPEQGFVEVYVRGNLELWHDGFEWNYSPYKPLAATLDRFLDPKSHESDDVLDEALDPPNVSPSIPETKDAILDAVRRLLDRRASSIIILLSPRDSMAFEEVAYEQLRRELVWAKKVSKIYVNELDAEALAGLLSVDGAHVIDHEGQLVHIARRIDAPLARYEVSFGPPGKSKSNERENHVLLSDEEECHSLADSIRSGINKSQRFQEFAIRSLGGSEYALQIFGFIDGLKWKSLKSNVNWIQGAILEQLKKQVFADQAMAFVVSYTGCSFRNAVSKAKDIINSRQWMNVNRLSGLATEQTPAIPLSLNLEVFRESTTGTGRILLPIFDNGRPLNCSHILSDFKSNHPTQDFENELHQSSRVRSAIDGGGEISLRLSLCYAVKVELDDDGTPTRVPQSVKHIRGAGMRAIQVNQSKFAYWFVLDDAIRRAAESREPGLPAIVKRELRALCRGEGSESHAGTGARAAAEIAKVLPRSPVIKVSASGSIKINNGRTAST